MRICFTVEFFDARGGGAGMVIREIAARLVSAGHDITVATSASPDISILDGKDGVKVVGFDISGNEVVGINGNVKSFIDFLNGGGFDVVMNYAAQSWHTDLTMQAIEKGALRPPAVVAPCGYSALREKSWRGYFRALPGRLAGYKACIYHSAMYQDYDFAKRAGLNNSTVIHNGASELEFGDLPAEGVFREKYSIGESPLLLCVANHFKSKGHHFIIKALDKLEHKNAKLVIIGQAPGTNLAGRIAGCSLRCRLKQALRPGRLLNLHGLCRDDIIAAYNDADLFVFGSDIECSPLVIIEAMASGTPFLSRPVGNVTEWADCGRIVQTPSDMARCIDELLDNGNALAELGNAGRRRWEKGLTWEIITKKYEEVLAKAARNEKIDVAGPPPPKVSVIMPVYNAEQYLRQSLDSILQSDFEDMEIIAVDDGSTDGSAGILKDETDPRLKVITQDNQGVSGALNTALAVAKGRYIARLDSDDICMPGRISEQVRFLDENPDVDIVAGAALSIDGYGNEKGIIPVMNHPLVIRRYLMEGNCVIHPTIMARSRVFEQFGGYRVDARHVEDYDLWARAWPWLRIAALPEPAIRYRVHESQVTKQFTPLQIENADKVRSMIWEQANSAFTNPARCFLNGMQCVSELKEMTPRKNHDGVLQRHIAAMGLIKIRALARGNFRILAQVSLELAGMIITAPIQGTKLFIKYFAMLIKEMSPGKAAEKLREGL